MSGSRDSGRDTDDRWRRKVLLAQLEADIAYFQARLEILGEPASPNQIAQRRAFETLNKALGNKVLQLKREMVEGG